ncbi:MAG TPA: hypothetical protein VGP82_21310 [Ktedonobacterales bacterium]|jgi:hypothetical protein|nr:hypothetical protein [Ktedonobacterales bacterium]
MLPTKSARFSFVDEGEAVRRLGIERDELLALVQSKQLRAYPGVNKGYFFRVSDLDALATKLHPEQQMAADLEAEEAPNPRKQHDPAYKVHLRLQADLKWYDLTDDDFRAYIRELHPSAYEKQRMNVTNVVAKLERLVAMMDESATSWKSQAAQPVMFVKREKPAADVMKDAPGPRKPAPEQDDTPKR